MERVWVGRTNHDFANSGGDDGIGAWRGAAKGATWFQCHIKHRAFAIVAASLRMANGLDFSMGFARATMPTFTNDLAGLHQDCTNQRIWRGEAVGAPRQSQGPAHMSFLSVHRRRFALESLRVGCGFRHPEWRQ